MEDKIISKPFLKWAGGKTKIVPKITDKLGSGKRLVEPFVGSGAVFMGTDFESYLLCDTNNDLIDLFNNLKHKSKKLILETIGLFNDMNKAEEIFYDLRNEFNTIDSGSIRKSALFVYLNRHAFNGLCRYNSKGKFNVPFGRYKNAKPPIKEMELFAKKSQLAEFKCCDFKETFNLLTTGDVVYCDPPYVPLSITSSFTSYHVNVFADIEQRELAKCAELASENGYKVVISNHLTDYTKEIYAKAKIDTFNVMRFISSKAETRGEAKELLASFG